MDDGAHNLWPIHVTSDPYIRVELTIGSCRWLADMGGAPYLLTMERSRLSTVFALEARLVVNSLKPSRGSSQMPSHIVALRFQGTRSPCTRTPDFLLPVLSAPGKEVGLRNLESRSVVPRTPYGTHGTTGDVVEAGEAVKFVW